MAAIRLNELRGPGISMYSRAPSASLARAAGLLTYVQIPAGVGAVTRHQRHLGQAARHGCALGALRRGFEPRQELNVSVLGGWIAVAVQELGVLG
jgi:hypothetical protein